VVSQTKQPIRVLALCGSLRAASLNALLLQACVHLAPPGVQIDRFDTLGALPLFNPDLEAIDPLPVRALRTQIIAADALLIASPEYAHGVSGVMKNALDWMVGCEAFVEKPFALLNASPRATHARAALYETLVTMSAWPIDAASIAVPLLGAKLALSSLVNHPVYAVQISAALGALRDAVQGMKHRGPPLYPMPLQRNDP
jgi:chromate reductase, NAD(P)H dehydrogenase (quinone)